MLALILGDTGEPGDERMRLGPPLMVGGLSLVERAVLAAHRAGAGRSVATGVQDVRGSMAARLRARGADVTFVEWGAAAASRPVGRRTDRTYRNEESESILGKSRSTFSTGQSKSAARSHLQRDSD